MNDGRSLFDRGSDRAMIMKQGKKEGDGVVKSVFMAYLVIILNVVVIGIIGLVVLLFQGIVSNMVWILLGLLLAVGITAYWFYKRVKNEGRILGETLNSPVFQKRPVEISFLGGVVSLKVGSQSAGQLLDVSRESPVLQLEDPTTSKIRELSALAKMLEDNLITPEEYHQFKEKLLGVEVTPK
jgi:hypothetical protein